MDPHRQVHKFEPAKRLESSGPHHRRPPRHPAVACNAMSDGEEEELKGRSEPTTQMSMMRYKHKSHTRSHLLKELRALNVTAKEARRTQHTLHFTYLEKAECAFTIRAFFSARLPIVQQLVTEGHSLDALKNSGYSLKELRAGGFTLEQLKNANATKQLKASGIPLADLKKAGYTLADFRAAGYSAKELRTASQSALATGGDSTQRAMGYSVLDLKSVGYMLYELQSAGYSCAELKAGGFKLDQLRAAGFTAKMLRKTGCSAPELKAAGFNLADLKLGGFQVYEIKNAGYSHKVRAYVRCRHRILCNACRSEALTQALTPLLHTEWPPALLHALCAHRTCSPPDTPKSSSRIMEPEGAGAAAHVHIYTEQCCMTK